MKNILVIVLLFIGNILYAQGPQIILNIKTENDATGKSLGGVTIEILQDGKKISTETSSSKGKLALIALPVGHLYSVKFKKQGFVTKMAQIDGRYDTPEDLEEESYQELLGALFESAEGIDFSFLENEPIIKFEFTPDGYQFSYDKAHLKQMQKKIADLKKRIEKEKENVEAKEIERKKREADFQTYVDAGDKAVGKSDYQIAIDQFNLALKLIDEPEVKTKLANAQKLLADAESNAQKEKDYSDKLVEAKTAFDSKKYENSIALYQAALVIKPSQKEPQDQILKIQGLLAKQQSQQAEFNKLVSEGNANVQSENYDVAIEKYTKALDINSNDADVKSKLDNARKLEGDKANAEKLEQEKEANFKALMVTAESLVQKEDWQAAKDKYNEALKIKPNESNATSQIVVIDKKIAELKANEEKLKETQEKYVSKMAEANSAFASNDFSKALVLYNEAKLMKPNENEPQVQINKINDAQKLQASKEADFFKFEKLGDVALEGGLYEDAINSYEKALGIKASTEINNKITKAKKLRDDKINADNIEKANNEKYEAAIKAADIFYDTDKWEDALVKYKEALVLKSSETHPSVRIKNINDKLAQLEAENTANDQLNKEYNVLVAEANTLYDANKLEEAKLKYTAALGKKAGEKIPINRIELINSTLIKQAADKKIEEKYLTELNAAKVLFDKKEYEEALSKYNLAGQIKKDEQEPKDQIVVINKILNDQKNSDELEEEYNKFMVEGNSLLGNSDLTTALDRFNKALNVKENDALATSKIKEVEKIIKDKQEAELKQKEFDEFVKKGEIFLNAKNYQDAKLNYSKAIKILPDAIIEEKLKEIDVLIAENQSASEQQKLFDDAMKLADDLFKANKYEEALSKYEAVNSIKNSQHANDRINTIKKEMADSKVKAENEAKFNELVKQGNSFESSEDYQKALVSYKEALTIKSDPNITKKISELGVLILNAQSDAQKKQAYIDMVDKANVEFNNKNWSQAIDYYKKAKKFSENETYPDERIAIANSNIESELNLEAREKYQSNIDKADTFLKSENLDEAVEYYKKALVIKSDEQYPKDQLDAIKKIKADKANVATNKTTGENAYKTLVKEADNLLNAENFSEALKKYEEALSEKPTDFYVISQVEKVKLGLEKENNQKEKRVAYDKLISEGDALMKPGTWNLAKLKYESALGIFNKNYPTNQIIICDEMMKKDSGSEAEKAYQKILTVAQKKMDGKNYVKAISLYERALSIRPSDSKPQAKIDEINQILLNLGEEKVFNDLLQKADNLFEKKEWKKARGFYVKAYAINNDKYADSQINKIDELDNAYNMKQYKKMVSKADEYFIDESYVKSKGLYERAIKFLPNYDNTYPINRIQEIKDILNPPLAIDNGVRSLGEKVVGMTEEEMDALLANDSEQRKFNEVNSVKTITKEISSEKSEWSIGAKESTNRTKDRTDKIAIDQEVKGIIAEVERVKAEKGTIEQREIYDKVQRVNAVYTNQARFNQIRVIKNTKVEIAESVMNADIPRSEYEKEVVGINTNLKIASKFQSVAQKNESFNQKEYVNVIQKTHVTQDPNNDVARKNTVDKSSEIQKVAQEIASVQSRNQIDVSFKAKTYSVKAMEEIRISNIENDIPRQNTVDKAIEIQEVNQQITSSQSKSQLDASYDTKTYTDKAAEEIRIKSIANDVPRQKMELRTDFIYDDVAEAKVGFVINQSQSTNSTKDLITEEIGIQQEMFSTKNKEREDDAENVIDLKEGLDLSAKIISNKNKDVSFATKDYAEKQKNSTTQLKKIGNNSTIKNQDKAVKTVKELNKKTSEKIEQNNEKVNGTIDYITKMKDIDIKKIDVNVKNQLGTDFPEGVTEEIYQVKDAYGLLLSFVVRRVVVTGGEGNVYEKTKSRHGVTSYSKNGDPISKQVWQDKTANASLKSN